jgi:WD40 repeat protein
MSNTSFNSFYVVGGTVNPDSPSYVVRQADQELFDRVLAGEFCYVLTSRQMGKSSLMARTAKRLATEAHVHTAIVDLTQIGGQKADLTAEQWFYGIAHRILRELKLRDVDLQEWWQARAALPALQRLTEFFSDLLLERLAGQIVIFIDEIDSTLSLPFTDDFFAAIRACYNARATDAAYNRLSFVLLGVASPSDLMKDNARTPFNIGHRIELSDFTEAEAQPLLAALNGQGRDGEKLLRCILAWTGGHPYLTQKLCRAIQDGGREGAAAQSSLSHNDLDGVIDALVERSFFTQTASREDSNLNFVRDWLTGGGKLTARVLKLYSRIHQGQPVNDAPLAPEQNHLKLSGIVKLDADRTLRVRNRIYERVFTSEWARRMMPPLLTQGQRRTIASVAALLLIAFGFWYTVFLPRPYIAALQAATDDYPAQAYNSLRRIPGYGGKADELLAQFWERRALRNNGKGRDETLLERLQALAANPTELRRKEADLEISSDYPNLVLTLRLDESVYAIAYSTDGKRILTGSADNAVRQWDAETGHPLGKTLYLGLVVSSNSRSAPFVWNEFFRNVCTVAYSPDGKRILAGNADNTAQQWNTMTGDPLGNPLHLGAAVTTTTYGPDGSVSRGESWPRVRAVAYSPDGKRVLTANADSTARQWDVQSGQPLGNPLRHGRSVNAVTYSPDSKRVLTGSADGTAQQWDAQTGQLLAPALRHGAEVNTVAYSSNGKLILTGGADGWVQQWDAQTGQPLSKLAHPKVVNAVSYSPDIRRVLTGGADGAARQWDVQTGQPLGIPFHHRSAVNAVSYSPNGKRVLTGSSDGTARQWDAQTGQFIGQPNAPLPGEPGMLLEQWLHKLALKFDENHKLVPRWPVETGNQPNPDKLPRR